MLKQFNKNNCGFTIIEIIVVLLLISIIAATAFQRSISTDQMHFRGQFDKIQNQMRYPQSIAMKQNGWWGISNDTTHYWIFTGTNKDTVVNQRRLPGQEDIKISLADLEVTMTPSFTVIFDSFGIPYWGDWNTRLTNEETVNLTGSGSPPKSFNIVPETGLIR